MDYDYLLVAWAVCGALNYGWIMAAFQKLGDNFLGSFIPAVTFACLGPVGTAVVLWFEWVDTRDGTHTDYGWRAW